MGVIVAEWLILRHTAAAPIVILATKERLLNIVRADLSLNREGLLMILETSLELLDIVSLQSNSLMLEQVGMQE